MALTRNVLLIAMSIIGLSAAGCIHPPGVQTVRGPDQLGLINPDDLRVDSNSYAVYVAVSRLAYLPVVNNHAMVSIGPTDVWRRSHRIGDRLLIHSDEYQERQCRYELDLAKRGRYPSGGVGRINRMGKCEFNQYLYHIFIN